MTKERDEAIERARRLLVENRDLKDYMVERLELADCKRIKTIKNILADVTDYSSFILVINDINNIIKEDEIEFYIFKNGYKK